VFSQNFGKENLMVQFVFNEHQCMFINIHHFSIDQFFKISHESYSYLMIISGSMIGINIMFSYDFGIANLMVQSVFNEHQCMFMKFHC